MIEPLVFNENSRFRRGLNERVVELVQRSTSLRYGLPQAILAPLADLVRSMNCYYSNLIEGHSTHPLDIERALHHDFSDDARQRDLQREAVAHIAVQQWLDAGGLAVGRALSVEGICEIHRRFFAELPHDMLAVTNPDTHETLAVVPGALRQADVAVGRHVPVSPGALPRFLARFETVYSRLGKAEMILHAAAIHHRFTWIHPFLDGNGRVARLVTDAVLQASLESGSVWSVSRGLARQAGEYKQLLAMCDWQRRNDLDGRGNLSEEALNEFTLFFLDTCLDQVNFMWDLLQPRQLTARILVWAEEEMKTGNLPPRSATLLQAILYRGELTRGEVADIVGTGDRQARRVVEALTKAGALAEATPRAPLRLALPIKLASRWLPGLIPPRADHA